MSTPGRVTRARSKTPLPAVGAKHSHAYGAKGKAELRSQVRGGTDDFADAFATGRSVAAGGASAPPSDSGRSGSQQPDAAPAVAAAPTAMDSIAGYNGGIAANQPSENGRKRPASMSPLARLGLSLLVLLGLFSGVLLSVVPMPSLRMEVARHNVLSGLRQATHAKPFDMPPEELIERWFRFQHDDIFRALLPDHNLPDLQWTININFLSRLDRLDARVAALESDMRLTNDTLAEIHRILPEHVLLRRVDGNYDIPEEFWQALQERMVENSDLAPRWQAFVLRNEEQIAQQQQQDLSTMFDAAVESRHLVTREIFTQAIQENNDWLAKQYSQELKAMWKDNAENLQSLTQKAATEIIERSEIRHYAKRQIDVLVRANQIHNANEALRSVNYFSAVAGAIIDPRITSSTAKPKQPNLLASLWVKIRPYGLKAHAPIMALTEWNEATECWCGSPDFAGGPVNIGVFTTHRVYPERLVIEHIPPTGTLDIAAAPRSFEVWADVGTPAEAERLEVLYFANPPPGWSMRACGPRPKPQFVCIYIDDYRIHTDNHVQTYRLWELAEQFGLATNRIVVRVNTNWGADHTCFYRLRLTGKQAL